MLPPAPELQVQTQIRGLPQQGQLAAEPAFANVGQPVVIGGTGFEPNKAYPLYWSTVTGNRVAEPDGKSANVSLQKRQRTRRAGWSIGLSAPDDLGGVHKVRVEDRWRRRRPAPSGLRLRRCRSMSAAVRLERSSRST